MGIDHPLLENDRWGITFSHDVLSDFMVVYFYDSIYSCIWQMDTIYPGTKVIVEKQSFCGIDRIGLCADFDQLVYVYFRCKCRTCDASEFGLLYQSVGQCLVGNAVFERTIESFRPYCLFIGQYRGNHAFDPNRQCALRFIDHGLFF